MDQQALASKCMKYLLSANGTADRSEWWTVTLISDVLTQLAGIAAMVVWLSDNLPERFFAVILVFVAIFFLWLSLAVTFRRLRDRERPLWTIIFGLIPFVGWLWLLIECGFMPSALSAQKRTLVRRNVQASSND